MIKELNKNLEFYPTPKTTLDKILEGVKWREIKTVLEPSAGSGNIVDWLEENAKINYFSRQFGNFSEKCKLNIDCIEKDPVLQNVLNGKGYTLVGDDFLKYQTFKKYDLIIMNPPFSHGAKHLLKALDMQKNGGYVICILNAETIRNTYSAERQALLQKLEDLNAEITFMQNEFSNSEHKTDVEIAVVKVNIPKTEFESNIWNNMKKKYYSDRPSEVTDVSVNDFMEQITTMYNMEIEAGINLINEYNSLMAYTGDTLKKNCSPIISMTIGKDNLDVNTYVEKVRLKYWTALFQDERFTGNMTSNLIDEYRNKVNTLLDYDFSEFNIKKIQLDMKQHLVKGIEDCIIKLFDELSHQYAYDNELSKNIHYYNGWRTNKSWIINKKVIIPYMNAWSNYGGDYRPTDYNIIQKISDMEKALNYLAGNMEETNIRQILSEAEKNGQTKKIEFKYFTVTFFKKRTAHIEFTDLELLKKFNIFGAQKKGWLPYTYGKKKYKDMDKEEQEVVNEFEGKDSYEDTLNNSNYYIFNPGNALLQIGMN